MDCLFLDVKKPTCYTWEAQWFLSSAQWFGQSRRGNHICACWAQWFVSSATISSLLFYTFKGCQLVNLSSSTVLQRGHQEQPEECRQLAGCPYMLGIYIPSLLLRLSLGLYGVLVLIANACCKQLAYHHGMSTNLVNFMKHQSICRRKMHMKKGSNYGKRVDH